MDNYEELLKRLDIMAEGATPVARGKPYDIGDYWNVCEESAAAIRSLQAKLDAIQPRHLSEIDDAALVCFTAFGIPAWETVFKRQAGWSHSSLSRVWPPDTLAIPLSALAALEQKP